MNICKDNPIGNTPAKFQSIYFHDNKDISRQSRDMQFKFPPAAVTRAIARDVTRGGPLTLTSGQSPVDSINKRGTMSHSSIVHQNAVPLSDYVVYGCFMTSSKGISLHPWPLDSSTCEKWKRFVKSGSHIQQVTRNHVYVVYSVH